MIVMLPAMSACGLDGVTGKVVRIDGESYHIHTKEGKEVRVHVDESTRMDEVSVGDEVHLYMAKNGHAAFVQKLTQLKNDSEIRPAIC
jgi:hypothetical protein